jgi:phosphohistidine phosphatase
MTRRLIIMRHAKSDWGNHKLPDHDRPLNERGRRIAPLMGRHLLLNKLQPQVILASTARRVRETVDLLQAGWPFEPVVFFEESLYLASAQTLDAHVRGLHDAWLEAMLVGHNPGLAEFVSRLANQPLEMPTAAVAVLESSGESWPQAMAANAWRLSAIWRPRELFD